MTEKERADMMAEIMNVVDKHVAKSENDTSKEEKFDEACNPTGDMYSTRAENMRLWKEEYKRIRVDGKTILEEVKRNPIDSSKLDCSFDVYELYSNLDSNK